MAEQKTESKPSKSLNVFNNGQRTINLKDGPNGAKRSLPPGAAIIALDQAEYDHLMRYRDISDAERMIPSVGNRIADLEKQVAALTYERDELLAKFAPKKDDGKKDGKKD